MLTEQQLKNQLARLVKVTWPQWKEALDELTLKIIRLLHGYPKRLDDGRVVMIGG